jgi:hypothetical protein
VIGQGSSFTVRVPINGLAAPEGTEAAGPAPFVGE